MVFRNRRMPRKLALFVPAIALLLVAAGVERDHAGARERMVATLERLATGAAAPAGTGGIDPSVLAAMREVPGTNSSPRRSGTQPTRTGRCRSASGRRFPNPMSSRS